MINEAAMQSTLLSLLLCTGLNAVIIRSPSADQPLPSFSKVRQLSSLHTMLKQSSYILRFPDQNGVSSMIYSRDIPFWSETLKLDLFGFLFLTFWSPANVFFIKCFSCTDPKMIQLPMNYLCWSQRQSLTVCVTNPFATVGMGQAWPWGDVSLPLGPVLINMSELLWLIHHFESLQQTVGHFLSQMISINAIQNSVKKKYASQTWIRYPFCS